VRENAKHELPGITSLKMDRVLMHGNTVIVDALQLFYSCNIFMHYNDKVLCAFHEAALIIVNFQITTAFQLCRFQTVPCFLTSIALLTAA